MPETLAEFSGQKIQIHQLNDLRPVKSKKRAQRRRVIFLFSWGGAARAFSFILSSASNFGQTWHRSTVEKKNRQHRHPLGPVPPRTGDTRTIENCRLVHNRLSFLLRQDNSFRLFPIFPSAVDPISVNSYT